METYTVAILSEQAWKASGADAAWGNGETALRCLQFSSDATSKRGENIALIDASNYAKRLAISCAKGTDAEDMIRLASPGRIRQTVQDNGHAACMVNGQVVVVVDTSCAFSEETFTETAARGRMIAREYQHRAEMFANNLQGALQAAQDQRVRVLNAGE